MRRLINNKLIGTTGWHDSWAHARIALFLADQEVDTQLQTVVSYKVTFLLNLYA
jgi:hypothetical protein